MLNPKVIRDVAVLIHDIKVRSWDRRVRSIASRVLASPDLGKAATFLMSSIACSPRIVGTKKRQNSLGTADADIHWTKVQGLRPGISGIPRPVLQPMWHQLTHQ